MGFRDRREDSGESARTVCTRDGNRLRWRRRSANDSFINRRLLSVNLRLPSDMAVKGAIRTLAIVWSQSAVKILHRKISSRSWRIRQLQAYLGFYVCFRARHFQMTQKVPPSADHFNISSREPLVPTLVIHGTILSSYNDGSFFVERRSRRRPLEWVIHDSYPRASLEVTPPPPAPKSAII